MRSGRKKFPYCPLPCQTVSKLGGRGVCKWASVVSNCPPLSVHTEQVLHAGINHPQHRQAVSPGSAQNALLSNTAIPLMLNAEFSPAPACFPSLVLPREGLTMPPLVPARLQQPLPGITRVPEPVQAFHQTLPPSQPATGCCASGAALVCTTAHCL